jgi:hypothetical protein
MRGAKDKDHIVNGYGTQNNSDINLNNRIISEFKRNVKKCIDEMVANSTDDKLYLNVASHEARWGILPVLSFILNELRKENKYEEIFKRLVVNVITGHDHNESIWYDKKGNMYRPKCNEYINDDNDAGGGYWFGSTYSSTPGGKSIYYHLPKEFKFNENPVINILIPGPFGEKYLKMEIKDNDLITPLQ